MVLYTFALNAYSMKKPFRVNAWSHLIIEGYCMCNVDYDHKSSKHMYKLNKIKNSKDPLSWEKEPNPDYDPTVQPDERPAYCTGHICIECLRDREGMCPHFSWCGVEKKVKKKFRKMINKMYSTD
jgi:hypothetical protein